MTEAMRRQYWVNELFEPIDAPTAERCYRTVFPGREVSCLAFGMPDLDFDLEAGNAYLQARMPGAGLAQPRRGPPAMVPGEESPHCWMRPASSA